MADRLETGKRHSQGFPKRGFKHLGQKAKNVQQAEGQVHRLGGFWKLLSLYQGLEFKSQGFEC